MIVERTLPAIDALQAAPWGLAAVVALLSLAGIILWLMGRRVLRPMTLMIFAAIGAAGALLASALIGMRDVQPVVVLSIAGSIGGVLIGVLLYRSAVALALGVICAVAAPLITGTWITIEQAADNGIQRFVIETDPHQGALSTEAIERAVIEGATRIESRMNELGNAFEPIDPANIENSKQVAKRTIELSQQVGTIVGDGARASWDSLSANQRVVLAGTSIAGFVVGVLSGLAFVGFAAGVVTAAVGSAVWLTGLAWLSATMSAPWRELLSRPAADWLVTWAIVTIVGMFIQSAITRGNAGVVEVEAA